MEQNHAGAYPAPRPMPDTERRVDRLPGTDRPGEGMTGEGRLVFQVSAAGGAIPLEGAEVTVRSLRSLTDGSGGEVIAVLYTGPDGKTEVLSLPAPARILSQTPSRDGAPSPFALYDAEIYLNDFRRQSYIRIPVFDGITSIQHANLIPLPENGTSDGIRPDGEQFFEGENPDL